MDTIREKRGAVTTNFASLEYFIAQFITQHYFGRPDPRFMSEVLEDEYFSFGLMVKIFDKALSTYPDEYKTFPFQKLRRLQRLRNIIVHARLQSPATLDAENGHIASINGVFFHHGGEDKDVFAVFKEYEKLREVVQPALLALPGLENNAEVVHLRSN
jgi:hypothetical protein